MQLPQDRAVCHHREDKEGPFAGGYLARKMSPFFTTTALAATIFKRITASAAILAKG
ncbi:MAG: hypothetical protein JXA21_02440 [Anaerolineae bacterium]|nr:hypothetical protein [Anaerolineae bacterium]